MFVQEISANVRTSWSLWNTAQRGYKETAKNKGGAKGAAAEPGSASSTDIPTCERSVRAATI